MEIIKTERIEQLLDVRKDSEPKGNGDYISHWRINI